MPSSFARPTSASVHMPDLGRPARHLRARMCRGGLDRIDREQERPGLARHLEHVREIAPGRERDRRRRTRRAAGHAPPPARATPHPTPTRTPRPAPDRCARMCSSSVDLPIPGSPASSATDAGTTPAAQHPIDPGDAGGHARSSSGAEASVLERRPSPHANAAPGRRPAPRRWCPTGRSPDNGPPIATPAGDIAEHARIDRTLATCGTYPSGLTSLATARSRAYPRWAGARCTPAHEGSEGGMRYGCDLGARHRADAASLRFRVAPARPAPRLPLRDSSRTWRCIRSPHR